MHMIPIRYKTIGLVQSDPIFNWMGSGLVQVPFSWILCP